MLDVSPLRDAPSLVSDRAWRLGLLAVAVVFLAPRLIAFHQMGESVFGSTLLADAIYYQARSLYFMTGIWQQEEAFFMSPAYPMLLGVWYKVTAPDPALGWARVLNMIISGGTLSLLVCATRGLWGRGAALGAGLLWALAEVAIFYEQTVLMEISAGFATMAALFAGAVLAGGRGDDRSPRALVALALGTGVLTGISALFRGNTLVLVPLVAAAPLVAGGAALRPVHRVLGVAAVVAGTVIPLVPIALHNARAERDFVLLTSNMGLNLFIGNNPRALGVYEEPPTTSLEPRGLYAARQFYGRDQVSSREINDYWMHEARKFLSGPLGPQVTLMRRKVLLLLFHHDFPQIYHHRAMLEEVPVLRFPFLGWGVFYPLAAAGAVAAWRRRDWSLRVMIGAMVLLPLSILPFFITERYRLAYAPPFLMMAGIGGATLVRLAVLRRPIGEWRGPAAGFAALAVLSWPAWITMDERFRHLKGQLSEPGPELRAALYILVEDYDKAEELLKSVPPEQLGPVGLFSLAGIVMEVRGGDPCQAVRLLQLAEKQQPNQWEILVAIGHAASLCGDLGEARRTYEAALELHGSLTKDDLAELMWIALLQGDVPGARRALDRVVIQEPENAQLLALKREFEADPGRFVERARSEEGNRRGPRRPRRSGGG